MDLLGDIDRKLRMALLIGATIYLLVIFIMLKKKKLTIKYSIIWLISGFVLVIFAAFPYAVYVLRDIFHIIMPVNLVFMGVIAFMLLLLLSVSSAISELSEKLKRLTQTNAILEQRIRKMEEQDKK